MSLCAGGVAGVHLWFHFCQTLFVLFVFHESTVWLLWLQLVGIIIRAMCAQAPDLHNDLDILPGLRLIHYRKPHLDTVQSISSATSLTGPEVSTFP